MIRPVKPVAPPPPPSPPRKHPSGIRHPSPHGPAIETNEGEISTASFQDPPTMAAARQRLHEIARELPSQYDRRFDDETQARPTDDGLIMASRHREAALDIPYESLPSLEVARPYDEYEHQFGERDPATQLRAAHHDSFSAAPVARRYVDSGEQVREEKRTDPPPAQYNAHAYAAIDDEDSGPRERPRKNAAPIPQFDAAAYEANYPGVRRDEESYPHRRESYKAPRREDSYKAPRREDSFSAPAPASPHREESYRSASGRNRSEQSWPAPAPEIPSAPALPRDMQVPAGFVMGVQPLRNVGSVVAPMPFAATQIPEAFPPPQHAVHARSRTPMMGVPYQQPQPGYTAAASPRAVHATGQHMHGRAQTNSPAYAQPAGHQLQMTDVEEAQQGSKAGRFAWFVFGAAFGIFFAFFATGFASKIGKKDEVAFPPPAQLPTTQPQAPVAAAPPPVQMQRAPVAPPVVQQPAAPVAQLPAPPATFAAAPVNAVPPVASAPVAAAPVAAAPVAAAPVAAAPFAAPAPAPQAVAEAKAAAPQRAAAPAPAPAPRGQRAATIARRNAPPPSPSSSAPKALPNSGTVEASDDDAPQVHAPRAATASKDNKGSEMSGIGDLLSAGLGP